MITETELANGIVLSRVVLQLGQPVTIESLPDLGTTFFRVGTRAAAHVKYCSNRLSPWSFTFTEDQQERLFKLGEEHANVVICLVCGHDGVAAISLSDAWEVLGNPRVEVRRGSISVSRRPRSQYSVRGSNGPLSRKVADSDLVSWLRGSL